MASAACLDACNASEIAATLERVPKKAVDVQRMPNPLSEVFAQAPAKDGLLRRSRGGHLVEKTLERGAEVLR
jgi:hypothetical protein